MNKRKCIVVEVGYDEKIICLLRPATRLMCNLFQAIVLVIPMCTWLVNLVLVGHIGGSVKVKIVRAIIGLLLRHIKERRKDRLVQSMP